MSWEDTYKSLVNDIEATILYPPAAVGYIYDALLTILNLDSSGDGTAAEVALLNKMDKFWRWALDNWDIAGERKKIVKAINSFTEITYGDLTTFVNGVAWDNGCIPDNWVDMSEDIGYDVSGWPICS